MKADRMKSGRIALVAALAFAGIRPAPAQAPPAPAAPADGGARAEAAPGAELRLHDVRRLFLRSIDAYGPDIEFGGTVPAMISGATFTMDEPHTLCIDESRIQLLITDNIAPGTWEDAGNSYSLAPTHRLFIRHTPDVHEQVDRLISHLLSLREHQIVVEGTAALVEDALLDAWRAGGSAPAALPDAAAKDLDAALETGRRASLVSFFRCVARNGQRVSLSDVTGRSYVRSYERQVKNADGTAIPRDGHLALGTVMAACPLTRGDRILCGVRFMRQTGTLPIPSFETGVPGLGPVGLPEVSYTNVGAMVAGRSGETLLVARLAAPDPKAAADAPARSLCFFVRPTLVPVQPVPAPGTGGPLRTRLVDVSALTHGSYWLRAKEFDDSDEVPDPSAHSIEDLFNAIQRDIEPGTWEKPEVPLDYNSGFLVVRRTPAVADQVVKWIERQAPRHFRRIAVRADLLMADRAALRSLLEKHPGLDGASVTLDAEEAARLAGGDGKRNGIAHLDSADLAGVSGQYLNLKRVERFAYVMGYSAGAPPAPALPDVGVMTDGFILQFVPALSDDGKTVRSWIQFYGSRPAPSAPVRDESGRRIRRPAAEEARWRREIVAAAGAPVLVDVGLKATVGGEPQRLLLLVRFTPVP
jgi:hypothetical protein